MSAVTPGIVHGTLDFKNTYAYYDAEWLTSISQQRQGGDTVAAKLATFQYDAAGDTTGIQRDDATADTSLVASGEEKHCHGRVCDFGDAAR